MFTFRDHFISMIERIYIHTMLSSWNPKGEHLTTNIRMFVLYKAKWYNNKPIVPVNWSNNNLCGIHAYTKLKWTKKAYFIYASCARLDCTCLLCTFWKFKIYQPPTCRIYHTEGKAYHSKIYSVISSAGENWNVSRPLGYDDVIKWKHFPRYWPFVRGNHRSPVNSPHKGQWRGALMFTLICTRINGWVYNCEAGDLRRNFAHYDVIVMTMALNRNKRRQSW